MTYLPPNIDQDDEVDVRWERDDLSTKVVVTLGEASIVVECSEDGAETVPWLVAALPNILEAAWAAIEDDETPQEEK